MEANDCVKSFCKNARCLQIVGQIKCWYQNWWLPGDTFVETTFISLSELLQIFNSFIVKRLGGVSFYFNNWQISSHRPPQVCFRNEKIFVKRFLHLTYQGMYFYYDLMIFKWHRFSKILGSSTCARAMISSLTDLAGNKSS